MRSKPANDTLNHQAVYDLIQSVPAGKVTTYGDLAMALGNPGASRAIGRILGQNPNPIVVPCHRVVMSDGRLGGYANGILRKKELLEREGLAFAKGSVNNFDQVRIKLPSSTHGLIRKSGIRS